MLHERARAESFTSGTTLIYVFVPALLVLAFFVVFAPLCARLGLPSLLAVLAAIPIVVIPAELGTLLFLGKKRNGRFSLEGIVLYREKIPAWLYPVGGLILFLWAGLCIAVFLKGIDEWTERTLFAWLPPWFYVDDFAVSATSYSPAALKVTAVALLLLNGLPGPIVEELYFRGFLLPRMERYGRWAPALNVLLFSLYHLYIPWQNLSRIVGLLPLAYFVRHKRNIYVGMIAHCALNLVGSVFLVVLAFAGS